MLLLMGRVTSRRSLRARRGGPFARSARRRRDWPIASRSSRSMVASHGYRRFARAVKTKSARHPGLIFMSRLEHRHRCRGGLRGGTSHLLGQGSEVIGFEHHCITARVQRFLSVFGEDCARSPR